MAMSEQEKAFLEKLEEVVDQALHQKGVINFTPEEAELLKRVAARERAWASIGALAGSVKAILTWFGVMIGMYMAARAGLLSWLTTALGLER